MIAGIARHPAGPGDGPAGRGRQGMPEEGTS
jgi:hypothetical protein